MEVLAFNNVSAASLQKHIFIVQQPCQPPPVKNMGPGKVQVGAWGSLTRRVAALPPGTSAGDASSGDEARLCPVSPLHLAQRARVRDPGRRGAGGEGGRSVSGL